MRACVYCGSSAGADPAFADGVRALAGELARRGAGVVYGGGAVGLMGALADAALDAGAEVVGVIPRALMERELGHRAIGDLRVVGSMHERKALMADLSDAFIAAPGGIGTLEELVEVYTWLQLGLHDKPLGLLDVGGYWQPLVVWLDHAVEAGFLREATRAALVVDADPATLLDRLGF